MRSTHARRSVTALLALFTLAWLPGAAAAQTVAVRADRMLDVETGRIVSPAVVVVEDGRIARVGGPVPDGARVMDLGDVTLLPGLIDSHVHLTGQIEPGWQYRSVTETATDGALRAVPYARRTLDAGFTTVRDVGAGGFSNVALAHAVERGDIAGPWIVPAGHSLGITGGHCDVTGYAPGIAEQGPEGGVADGPAGVLRAARYQIKHGARVIKICATAGVLSFEETVGAQQFSEAEMRTIVEEADRHGMNVAAHAHGTEGIKAAVRAGVASIEHGSILDDEAIRLMLERGTYLVPTVYLGEVIDMDALPPPIRAKAEFVLPRARESVRNAIAAGVRIAFGTDAAVYPHGQNAREFRVLVELGMTPIDAIRSATLEAARLLQVDDDRGRIAEGLSADLIAVPGNPLDDVTLLQDVRFVMRGGTVYKQP